MSFKEVGASEEGSVVGVTLVHIDEDGKTVGFRNLVGIWTGAIVGANVIEFGDGVGEWVELPSTFTTIYKPPTTISP